MALTCNIDSRGRLVRLIYGILLSLAGVCMALLWAWRSGSGISWFCSICVIFAGLFAIFEARAGWCALRAIGMRTPM
jgi:hypothetical protein